MLTSPRQQNKKFPYLDTATKLSAVGFRPLFCLALNGACVLSAFGAMNGN